jgi:hypothetical protein
VERRDLCSHLPVLLDCSTKEGIEMKTVLSFLAGMMVCLVIVVVVSNSVLVARADETGSGQDMTSLLPDTGKIYRTSLGAPYRQVDKEIRDKDIAKFYHQLMQETGLDKIGLDE